MNREEKAAVPKQGVEILIMTGRIWRVDGHGGDHEIHPKERKGLVVVITGYGKGKTTTPLGFAVRACGHDMKVCIIQFMKGDLYSGEWDG